MRITVSAETLRAVADHKADAGAMISHVFWWANRTATTSVAHALHTFGGYGLTEEYDIQLYHRRAKAWGLIDDTFPKSRFAEKVTARAKALAGTLPGKPAGDVPVLEDPRGIAAQRYDAKPGTVYLLRPDQHVAARWRTLDPARVKAAVARATCNA